MGQRQQRTTHAIQTDLVTMPSDPMVNPASSTLNKPGGRRPDLITYIKHKMIARFLRSSLASWKSTSAGIILILIEVNHAIQGEPMNWELIMVGVGLIFAKDGDVSNSNHPVPVARAI